MKQVLLRVPDDVHRRLAARAARDGRSINTVATEILDSSIDADGGDRRCRLRARAAATGLLRARPAPRVGPARRGRVIASTTGFGAQVDRLLSEDRDRV